MKGVAFITFFHNKKPALLTSFTILCLQLCTYKYTCIWKSCFCRVNMAHGMHFKTTFSIVVSCRRFSAQGFVGLSHRYIYLFVLYLHHTTIMCQMYVLKLTLFSNVFLPDFQSSDPFFFYVAYWYAPLTTHTI